MSAAPTSAPESGGDVAVAAPPATSDAQTIEVTEGYQRFDFDAPQTAEPTPAPVAKAPEAVAPATKTPEASAPAAETTPAAASDELTDEQIEAVLRNEKAKARIEQLANNRLGNRLQVAEQQAIEKYRRTEAEAETKWKAADDYYRKLEDDDFYMSAVRDLGEAKVLKFRADYLEGKAAREAAGKQQPQADFSAQQEQFTRNFNAAAIGELKAALPEVIPFYAELPETTRSAIEKAQYDPNGNWFVDSMTALGKGFQAHVDTLNRKHETALREAMEAGKNDASAAREERAPIVISGETGVEPSFKEIDRRFSEGDPSVTREMWNRSRRNAGIKY